MISRCPKKRISLALRYATLSYVGMIGNAHADKIEEVIVTAQKSEENLQQVPIAITALSGETLEKKGITNFAGIAQNTPSISFAPFPGSSNTLILYMRGQGAAVPNAPSSEGGVGVYQDGFYVGRPSGLTFDMADLERVEVLRGPQGTLYGRNTTGGAVNLISRLPKGEFDFRQTLEYGTRNQFRSLTVVDLPRWGDLSAKVSLLKSGIDGDVKNAGSGADFGEQSQQGGRLQLHWEGADGWRADYFSQFDHIDDTPLYYQNASLDGLTVLGYPYTHAASPRDRSYRPVDLNKSSAHSETHGLTLTWDASDALTIKSLTGYRELHSQGYSDFVEALTIAPGIPFQDSGSALTKTHQFSQELQFIGKPSDSIRYVGGLYYFDEGVSYETVSNFPDFFLSAHQISNTQSRSKAAFGQITWTPPFAENRLDFTLGGRYTRDERDSTRFLAYNGFILEDGRATGSVAHQNFSKFNPAFTVDYRWTDNLNTYAKVATGYRAGGTYEGAPANQFGLGVFGPEQVTSYEVGLKSDWWDRRLRFNLALFDSRYRDLQIYVPIDPNDPQRALYYNVGKATVRGAEMELTLIPIDDVTLGLNYSYLDPKITRVDVIPGSIYDHNANALSPYQVGDNLKNLFVMPYAPKDSLSANVEYTLMHWSNADLAMRFDYRWESQTYSGAIGGPDVPNRQFNIRPSYGLTDGLLTLSVQLPHGDSAKVSLWGKNIFDKRYKQQVIAEGAAGVAIQSPTTGFVTPAGYRDQAVAYAEPPSYGIRLQYDY